MIKNNLIGISGKIGSGKDTLGIIIQYLSSRNKLTGSEREYLRDLKYLSHTLERKSDYQIKKFADKIKDMVCLLIGSTREQLEDREFKEKELGQEWWYISKPEIGMFIPYTEDNWAAHGDFEENLVMLTPRKLLQLLGTECGRQIIHPNIWVNALFADYKAVKVHEKVTDNLNLKSFKKPNWIITDVRFPNEAQAIKDRGGVVIRVNRTYYTEDKKYIMGHDPFETHPSETALDDYEFDHVIDNNGSIEDLIEKVKQLKLV